MKEKIVKKMKAINVKELFNSKNLKRLFVGIRYFSVMVMGMSIAVMIECVVNIETVGLGVLAVIVFVGATLAIRDVTEAEESQ